MTKALPAARASADYKGATFTGWRRENGRVGVRNHVVILPLDDLSNAACEAVANNVKGTLALPHAYGRLQFGEDLEIHFRTLIGFGSNPNVAAVVVIGIEDQWTNRVVEGIAKTGKPVVGFGIEGHGDIATIAKASYQAKRFVQWATELPRETCPIADLWVSTKCGESDTTTGLSSCPTVGNMYDKLIPHGIYGVFGETSEITGAEHLCRERAASPEIADKWYAMWKAYQDDVIEAHKTDDLSDSQPTKGNIAGGLTTIEEKALGNLEKIGHTSKFIDALQPAEAPAKGPGLYYMDTSSAAAECVTGLVMPAGLSFNMDGSCIYLTMAIGFIAQALNVPLTWEQELGILLIALVTSKGVAGVVGAVLFVLAAILQASQLLPVAGIALIIGVDRILNELRCITNAIGNMVATLVIARWEGKIDLAHARAVLDGRIRPDLETLDEPEEALDGPVPAPVRPAALPAAIPAT